MNNVFVAVAVSGILVATSGLASAADVATGKALYMSHCAACHRPDASGGLKFGKAVSADLRSPGLENTYSHSDALILRAILEGKDEEGGSLDAPMPHWKGQITAQQASDILDYLKTLCCSASPETQEPKGQK